MKSISLFIESAIDVDQVVIEPEKMHLALHLVPGAWCLALHPAPGTCADGTKAACSANTIA